MIRRSRTVFVPFVGLALALFSLSSIAQSLVQLDADLQATEEHAVIMGTDVGIQIYGESQQLAQKAINAGFAEMRRIDQLMTDWRPSEFEKINQNAGLRPTVVSDEIIDLVQESIRISKITEGAFDISYAGVGTLWSFQSSTPHIPSQSAIKAALLNVGYEKIELDKSANSIYLPNTGMRIGLGGIAKGYAVDRAVMRIQQLGVKNFAVNAGGDLTVKGARQGELWRVSIRHPRRLGENIAILPISNGTVVTSGDSERYFEIDGKRYGHILDPRTGYPATLCQSVTIVAKTAYLADALATGVFVLGAKKGMDLIESLDHIEGLIVDAEGKLKISSGLLKSASNRKIL